MVGVRQFVGVGGGCPPRPSCGGGVRGIDIEERAEAVEAGDDPQGVVALQLHGAQPLRRLPEARGIGPLRDRRPEADRRPLEAPAHPAPGGQAVAPLPGPHVHPPRPLQVVQTRRGGRARQVDLGAGERRPADRLDQLARPLAQDAEEADDLAVQVVVDLAGRRGLAQQDRGGAPEGLHIAGVRRQVGHDPGREAGFATVIAERGPGRPRSRIPGGSGHGWRQRTVHGVRPPSLRRHRVVPLDVRPSSRPPAGPRRRCVRAR